MKFHHTNYGAFGRSLPADRNGYVTCSPRKVRACVAALRAGREPAAWANTGANLEVATADIALAGWRDAEAFTTTCLHCRTQIQNSHFCGPECRAAFDVTPEDDHDFWTDSHEDKDVSEIDRSMLFYR